MLKSQQAYDSKICLNRVLLQAWKTERAREGTKQVFLKLLEKEAL